MRTHDPFHVVPAMLQARAPDPPPHSDHPDLGPLSAVRAFRLAVARLALARLALERGHRGRRD